MKTRRIPSESASRGLPAGGFTLVELLVVILVVVVLALLIQYHVPSHEKPTNWQ